MALPERGEENDFDIEDLLGNLQKKQSKKKKKDSKDMGTRGERDLILSFAARFPDKPFYRVVGSGNRWAQVKDLGHNKEVFTGDIVPPPDFKFTIECKYGYENIELMSIFSDGHKMVEEWIKQSQKQADSIGKQPLLCWRKPHFSWLAFLPKEVFKLVKPKPKYHMTYRHLHVTSLSILLSQPDSFWFDVKV